MADNYYLYLSNAIKTKYFGTWNVLELLKLKDINCIKNELQYFWVLKSWRVLTNKMQKTEIKIQL